MMTGKNIAKFHRVTTNNIKLYRENSMSIKKSRWLIKKHQISSLIKLSSPKLETHT